MSPVAPECNDPGCPVSAHAATGWCLAATGAPVLVITTLACPPGDADTAGAIDTTLIDPVTGDVVAPQAIVACGDQDWEVNQLCDYDSETGEYIATFLQIFQWDEDTEMLTITLVRADDPEVVYVPVGDVRTCESQAASGFDVEVVPICYEEDALPGAMQRGFGVWVFSQADGTFVSATLYDQFGVLLVDFTQQVCSQTQDVHIQSSVPLAVYDNSGSLTVDPLKATREETTVIAASAVPVDFLVPDAFRAAATIYNDSPDTLFLLLGIGFPTEVDAAFFTVKLFTDDYYEVPEPYARTVRGVWDGVTDTGDAKITEILY